MSKDSEHEKTQQTTDMDEKNKTPCETLPVIIASIPKEAQSQPGDFSCAGIIVEDRRS